MKTTYADKVDDSRSGVRTGFTLVIFHDLNIFVFRLILKQLRSSCKNIIYKNGLDNDNKIQHKIFRIQ